MHQVRLSVQRLFSSFRLEVNLRLPAPGVSVLFGPSGAGKSSLLRILAGLDAKATGRLEVAGQVWQDDARGIFLKPHHRAVGYVFQEGALFPHLTVKENVFFGRRRVSPERRIDPGWLLGLLGLEPLLSRRPSELSGGEKQRVALGRALLSGPDLLLMDEPLASLDMKSRREILPVLESLARQHTVPLLYVTHSLHESARLGDYLVRLEAGRVVAEGPIERLNELVSPEDAEGDLEEVGALILGTVVGLDPETGLLRFAFEGGEFQVVGSPKRVGQRTRLRIFPSDVSLSRTGSSDSSIVNRLETRVLRIQPVEGSPRVKVTLGVGGIRLSSEVTQRSISRLNLSEGETVFAQFKACALIA